MVGTMARLPWCWRSVAVAARSSFRVLAICMRPMLDALADHGNIRHGNGCIAILEVSS
jgi:hypothetical protein